MKNQFPVLLIALLFPILVYAQSAIVPLGGDGQGIGGSVSVSVGQVAQQPGEGVQQPLLVAPVSKLDEYPMHLVAYPNPTSETLHLQLDLSSYQDVTYQLRDIKGLLLGQASILSATTAIDMQPYSTGVYVLYIYQGKESIGSFKIIKQ